MSAQALNVSGYVFRDEVIPSLNYMLPPLRDILWAETGGCPQRLFDLGCGKGDMAAAFASDGHLVCGIDPSRDGIALAKRYYPHLAIEEGSAYDDLPARFGRFQVVVSVDVVEYVYYPRLFAKNAFELLEPGGLALITAPFHGYFKNIAIAASGSMDRHFNSLQDYGRIKFWSMSTLQTLLEEAGFTSITFRRIGRIPALAKAMIAIARRPAAA